MIAVTPIYLSLAARIYVWLAARVIGFRISKKVLVGDHGDRGMPLRTRAHGYFGHAVF